MIRKLRTCAAALATLAMTACGVGQAVTDSTVDAAKWAFTTQVKTMNVELVSRASLNTNGAGQSLSTVVRIYQLKTPQAFQQLDYAQLQTNDLDALKPDLLATKDVVLRPDASASISEPMNGDAAYVGVVAFFRDAGRESTWKLLIPKKQWKNTDPVKIEARDNTLKLVGATADTVKRNAPQQSVPNPPRPKSPVSTEYGTQAG
ncbi:type VI secretion system lipoprotein TssJ [Paraburkholderia sp. BL25I1N1]|uniref:type VI secretion system lipoprotein TssJ n=1 Tax=Paraburkholderia sp. BL25I1N1 TaxID=1938804 RepID=UPI000D07EC6C|nr:type VI secretion system lipoprotein TssJ [Paraburkholderia sp. BL25I1N1]